MIAELPRIRARLRELWIFKDLAVLRRLVMQLNETFCPSNYPDPKRVLDTYIGTAPPSGFFTEASVSCQCSRFLPQESFHPPLLCSQACRCRVCHTPTQQTLQTGFEKPLFIFLFKISIKSINASEIISEFYYQITICVSGVSSHHQ